jgi:very-short-patch-repair endonuclease
MDVFELRNRLIADYQSYVTSFMALRDERIKERVETSLREGRLWPEARIGLNPSFESGGTVDELVADGLLHDQCRSIFRSGKSTSDPVGNPMRLHRHQVDAIREARQGRNYVLTTGTGSGKSLSYIVPIVDHVLRNGSGKGVQAIVVYPMNALANSQEQELGKFLGFGPGRPPVRVARYTGQEKAEEREAILQDPPDVILTNYVMLELILTRVRDQRLVRNSQGLRFLVLDELHTYRGRQGADVALLVRRVREACNATQLQCVGTSATLSTEGTYSDQRAAVGRVASLLFGDTVLPESVIGETLKRSTPLLDHTDPAEIARLRDRVEMADAGLPGTYEQLVNDPLSSWIESTLGVQHDGTRLTRVTPRAIGGADGVAKELDEVIGGRGDTASADAIRQQLMRGYELRDPGSNFPAFAFRLHQFVSKGDTVFASPEPAATRHLTLNGQRYVPGHRDRVLLPLSFCRMCGQDHYTVHRMLDHKGAGVHRTMPRDIGDQLSNDAQMAGFLVLDEGEIWSDDLDTVLERVPEDWTEVSNAGVSRIKAASRNVVPVAVRIDSDGSFVESGGTRMWWVPAPFRLCIRCGVSYDARSRSDIAKLTTLGSEGRSTATTVLSLSAVRSLRADSDLPANARKLLSFTDNRQDASLQAGHFNDFIQTTLLRAAIYRAVAASGPAGLEHDRIAEAVFKALNLPLEVYAVDSTVEFAARVDTEKALRDVLGYLTYLDLRRGWRLTSPNLEQCGLLQIDYQSLEELVGAQHVWDGLHPALAGAAPAERTMVARTLLDYLRRELAIKVDYLDGEFQERLAQRSSQRLQGMWAIDDQAQLTYANTVLPRPRAAGDFRGWSYLSSRSGFGRLLRRNSTFASYGQRLSLADIDEVLQGLFSALKRAGLVEEVNQAKDGAGCYQVPASALIWRAGDGTVPYRDPVRMPTASAEALGPNEFFVSLYRSTANDLVGIEGREHTAQVSYEDREDREARFRTAQLPVLYCSPTMELGVDIADLNVVNMRNVPPTPANYAQRSGRAGRSGQPALVFTYCSAGSPHDQWFFHRPHLMVAGQVSTPRLDVSNEDLVRAHVQAVWLSASGLSLGSSLVEVLDVTSHSVPKLFQSVRDALNDPTVRVKSRASVERVLADLMDDLRASTWWHEEWIDEVLKSIPKSFEAATQRWVGLYRSATQQFNQQNVIIGDISASADAKNQAKRLRREAEVELELLAAAAEGPAKGDFYSYRYFASEGFLPGYSFPRLPLSAFIPGRRGRSHSDGSFVSRSRFLAISEFGPRSLVYHEGNRFEINRVIMPVAEQTDASGDPILTPAAKRCESCGYLHPAVNGVAPDVCDHCRAPLPAAMPGLFRLHNVATRRRDRITADEEERQRQGFELQTAVRFAERHGEVSVRTGYADAAGSRIAKLTYGDTATLWRINLGRRRRARPDVHGFLLDQDKGYWGKEDDEPNDETPGGARMKRVIPFVEDRRNCLIIEISSTQSIEVMASLEAALKNAIQVVFQLEEGELASEPLPSSAERRQLLFFESAEGGAGVLRRLVDDPAALAAVARQAIELCHNDPVSGAEIAPRHGEGCEAACYDCLLSYRNQIDHELLDRRVLHPVLIELAASTVTSVPGTVTVDRHLQELEQQVDSELEQRFLDYLNDNGLRLPEQGQVLIEEARTRPDFLYRKPDVAIYVDGPHHLYPDRQSRDVAQTTALQDRGWTVIRFPHQDDWAQIIDAYRWVFGEGETA